VPLHLLSSTSAYIEAHVAGARAWSRTARKGRESFSKASRWPGIAKTHCCHSQRLTAVMASEKVMSCLPGQSTTRTWVYRRGNWLYRAATTVYNPNRHGAARSTVFSFQPRVVSKPRYERISWKVVSSFQRPT